MQANTRHFWVFVNSILFLHIPYPNCLRSRAALRAPRWFTLLTSGVLSCTLGAASTASSCFHLAYYAVSEYSNDLASPASLDFLHTGGNYYTPCRRFRSGTFGNFLCLQLHWVWYFTKHYFWMSCRRLRSGIFEFYSRFLRPCISLLLRWHQLHSRCIIYCSSGIIRPNNLASVTSRFLVFTMTHLLCTVNLKLIHTDKRGTDELGNCGYRNWERTWKSEFYEF